IRRALDLGVNLPGGSRIRTFGSAPDIQRFRGFVRVGAERTILCAAAQPSSCGPTNRSGPRTAIRGAAAHAESGGATEGGGALGEASELRNRKMVWGGRRRKWQLRRCIYRWSAAMPQPNDLSRSLVALDQNSTIIAVVELSHSSWLVAGMLP